MRMISCVLFLTLASLAAFGAEPLPKEADLHWPNWRGPRADGVSPGGDPPLRWDEQTNIRWKVEIPGKGNGTPIIWKDRLFLMTAIALESPRPTTAAPAQEPRQGQRRRRRRGIQPSEHRYVLMALSRRDGRRLWEVEAARSVPGEGTHTDGTWASGSPVTDGKRIIAHFGSQGTFAYDMDGKLLWKKDLGQMRTRNSFGEGASPALYDDTVVIPWDHEDQSFIVALDARDGRELWRFNRDEPTAWSTPIVVEHSGRAQVIVNATNRVRSYDLKTGQVIWESGGMTLNTIPSPVYGDGMVFVTSGFRGNALQAIRIGQASGDISQGDALIWSYDKDTPYVPSPLLYQNQLYILKHNRGILSCFDAKTGKVNYGPQRLDGLQGVYASPVGAAGRVYIAGRKGTTLVIEQGPEFKVLAANKLDEGFDASPAVADNEIYLRGSKHLYCIARN